mgnify:CR=1 FL=1
MLHRARIVSFVAAPAPAASPAGCGVQRVVTLVAHACRYWRRGRRGCVRLGESHRCFAAWSHLPCTFCVGVVHWPSLTPTRCVCVWCRQVVAESARSDAERLAKPVLSQADITAALDEVNCWDLIGHHLEAAFTGCVRPDTAMFIWDQVPRLRVTCHLQRVASDDDCGVRGR